MILRRLVPYWRKAWADTAIGTLLLALTAGLELLQPWPIKWLVDYVFGGHQAPGWLQQVIPAFSGEGTTGKVIGICLVIVLLGLAHRGAYLVSQYVSIRAGARIVKELRCRACDHVHRLSLSYHDRNRVGDSIYRIAYDTTAALSLLAQVFAPLVTGVLLLIGVLVVMIRLDAVMALVAAAVVPLFWLLIRGFGRRIENRSKQYHEHESSLVSILQESLSSIRAVQAFSREPETGTEVGVQADRSLRAMQRLVFSQLSFSAGVGLAMVAGTAAVVGIGAQRVISGQLLVGDVLVFLAYLGMLYQPINAFSQSSTVLHTARTQLKRVFAVLDTPPLIADRPGAVTLPVVRGELEFRDVTFAYEEGRPVLRDVNVVFRPGEAVAIVGRTGAGKTTLASLLLRFYDPTSGAVLLDGQDLTGLKLAWLRRQVGVVLQDAILFSSSIADNIAYARPDASRAEIEHAARQAQVDEFINALPRGYDTLLGERGVNLSGGQRQRIAIARAFLKDAPILVLDEPTSALDPHTESSLMRVLRELTRNRTTFIISHRLSTVRLVDRVVVLHGGRLIEQGGHDELLARDSHYRRLYLDHWKPEGVGVSETPGRELPAAPT